MTFANPLPWWILALVVCAAGASAWLVYRHLAASPLRRATLIGIRFASLLLLVLFLMRPVATTDDRTARDAIVPILVDTSRSMSIEDAGGLRRIDRARAIVTERLLPAFRTVFAPRCSDSATTVATVTPDKLTATARRSDLAAALAAVRERYRGQVIAGIVLLTDGGDTTGTTEQAAADAGLPVYAIGVGSRTLTGDREVLSVTAAEAVLDDSRVDLAVSAVSHGATAPSPIRAAAARERPADRGPARRIAGATARRSARCFRSSPRRGAATVYTVEIPAWRPESSVPENNARSVLVQPPSRPRRVLLVEGAPGFEHSFLKRALGGRRRARGRLGRAQGEERAGGRHLLHPGGAVAQRCADHRVSDRARGRCFATTRSCSPTSDGSMLTRSQLEATRDFVARRGGGLLVLGARSFLRQGLAGHAARGCRCRSSSPIATSSGVLPAAAARGINRVSLTAAGRRPPDHAARPATPTRPASAGTPSRRWPRSRRWADRGRAPACWPSRAAPAARPRALVAVQRYGEGRSMVFAGEASWRWRMMLPATDRSYDTFWRQAVRWLALPAADPVAVTVPAAASPGDMLPLRVARPRRRLRAADAVSTSTSGSRAGRTARAAPRRRPRRRRRRRPFRRAPTGPRSLASIASPPKRQAGTPRSVRRPRRCSSAGPTSR